MGTLPTAQALTADNPYAGPITNRNLFSLKPPPDPTANIPVAPPPPVPDIKLAGITTIMGGKRALLRVPRPARPPAPAAEVPLILQEGGPAEEGVRVLEINIATATVKIDNHGTIQTLDMDRNAPKAAPPPAGAPGIPVPPPNPAGAIPVPRPAVAPAVGGGITSIARPVRGSGPVAGSGSGGIPGGGMVGAGPAGVPEPQAPPPLTVEQQEVLIELERDRTKAAVEAGDLPPYPPTSLQEEFQQDQQAQPGQGGPPALPPF